MFEIVSCNSTKKHINLIHHLAKEIWYDYFVPILGKPFIDYTFEIFQSKDIIKNQLAGDHKYYFIKENKENIGYISFYKEEKQLVLSKFYLKCSCRGKGYGKLLIKFIERKALEMGLFSISLIVHKKNINSLEAYKKFGFSIKQDRLRDIGNGYFMDEYVMEKRLEPNIHNVENTRFKDNKLFASL